MFCGDLARIGGTVVIPASRGGDLAAYLDSLRRVRDLHPARLLPAHGPIDSTIPAAVIDEYLQHRRSATRRSSTRCGRDRSTAAGHRRPRLRRVARGNYDRAAADTVLAHLIKLRNEGRVHERDGSGRVGSRLLCDRLSRCRPAIAASAQTAEVAARVTRRRR